MAYKNIPILILNNIAVFPSTDIRFDFDASLDKNVLEQSVKYFDSNILLVYKDDPLEASPSFDELIKIGVIAKITSKMDLPNGRFRVTLTGIRRVRIDNFYKEENIIYAKYNSVLLAEMDAKEEIAYLRMLKRIVSDYIANIPYTSNTLIETIKDISYLDVLTDVVVASFEFNYLRKIEYIQELNQKNRANMLMEDIKEDFEIVELEKNIDDEVNKRLEKNQKDYVLREKINVIKEELGDVNDKDSEVNELRDKVNQLKCSKNIKNKLNKEINKYESFPPFSPEISTVKNYIDLMLELPWNNTTKEEMDLKKIKSYLDKSHYGMEDIKSRILDYIALKKWTNDDNSPILCFVGPPGVGKTTLAKSIAESLKRKYCKISVGGVQDEADIVGHRRTYIGSMPGMIINGMKKAGVSNPVFIIDEIDKMTKSIKGDPASSLLEVLDKEQNSKFVDHYVEEEYDLSKVMFITTANYADQIPLELLDRLEIIELSSYTENEKLNIAKFYQIVNTLNNYKLSDVKFDDDAIIYIIRNYTLEAGVRELDRVISKILRKVARERLESNNNDEVIIDIASVKKYLGKEIYDYNREEDKMEIGVVNGLSYTVFGGDTLKIEANIFKGKGDLILTGSLGEVIKESAAIALDYIKSNAALFNINLDMIIKSDIHLHFPEGAVKKDGPSAGIAITTVLLSVLKSEAVPVNLAMTGEVTLRGKVLPIGGLKEKVIGAKKRGITKIIIPIANKRDLVDIPDEVKCETDFVFVSNYLEVYNNIFKSKNRKKELSEDMMIRLDV